MRKFLEKKYPHIIFTFLMKKKNPKGIKGPQYTEDVGKIFC